METISTPTLDHIYSSVISDGEIVYSCTSCSHSYSVAADTTKEITFESNGGSACAPISVNYGSQLELPRPTKEGFDFAGWFFDQDLSNSCPTTLTVAEDTTLYAAWNESRIESVSEEKTLYVDVPLSFEFTVITDIELTNDNLGQYVFVKDHNGTAAKIYIASQDGNKYTIAGEDYKEVTTYEVFILQALSFEKSTSNTMWFITDGEKTTSIKFMPTVKHLNETDIYSMIQSEEKVFIFLLDDKFNPDDVVVVHGASEEEIVLAMKVVSEKTINDVYAYEIITAEPEEVYEETNIFYSGELDISEMELSETLEEDLVAALVSSELYAQIKEANVIFASERSTNKVKFTPKEIKIKPKFSVSGTKLYVQYTVSSIFEKETGNRTEEFSVSLAISNTTTFNSDVWFHWVDNFSLVFGARNEFQIDIFATGEMSYENNVEAFKQAFNKAKNSGKWKEVTSENASSSNATKLGNVDIPLNGVTISIELASNFEFKATGEIGISVKVTTDMQFGIRNTSWSGFEFVRSFNTRVDSTFVVRGKLEASYLLELKIGVKFAGVIEAYVKVGAGPYAEVSGMFVVSGSSNGGFNATAGGLIEIGLKTELTIGVTAKIETRVLWWNIKVVVFDVKHSWDLYKEPLFKFGSEEIALYFENQDDSASKKIICGQTVNISDAINKNVVFQKVDKLETSVSGVDCKYYLNESYDGVTLSADGVLSYSHTNFNHGDEIYIKIKVAYGSIYKITTLRLELCHDARSVKYTPPTCTTDGNNAYVYCYNCECIITGEKIVFPALGHSFSDEWSSNSSEHWHSAICEHNDLTNDLAPHSWNDGETTISSTCYSNGEIIYTCTVCSATKTEALDFLPHDFDEDGICKICKEGSPFIFEPIDDTTCKITGVEPNREIVEAIIPTTIKGYTVTSIASGAFKDQATIKNVTIPNTVTSIGLGAFENCNGIAKLTIPFTGGALEANTHLSYIFGGTTYNDSSYVPESLKMVVITDTGTIKKQAFSGCQFIVNISLPSELTTIEDQAFENCSSLIKIDVPETVTTIGYKSFSGCSSLESLTIPFVGGSADATTASSTTLFGYIFGGTKYDGGTYTNQFFSQDGYASYCIPEKLKNVTILGGKILYGGFFGCKSIVDVVIGDNVTLIDSQAFYGCSNLESVSMGSKIESINDSAFIHCTSLTDITIPSSVTSIGKSAFSSCTSLTSIEIPGSVYLIDDSAFNSCTALKNVTIGNGVKHIGNTAFYRCSIESLTIPDSVESIGNSAFSYCDMLSIVTIGNGVVSIGSNAFYCNALKDLTFGKSITSIGENAFSCVALENVNYLGSIEDWCRITFASTTSNPMSYSDNIFINGEIVTDIKLSNTITKINDFAFLRFRTITSIEFPNSITHIGKMSFMDCSSLASITIPDTVTYVGESAFNNCSSLNSATIGNGVSTLETSVFYNCTSLKNVTIGSNVKKIEAYAFALCKSLISIEIPNSVTSIESNSFSSCNSVRSLIIGDGITTIKSNTFSYFSSLTSLVLGRNVSTIENNAFTGCYKVVEIYNLSSVVITPGTNDFGTFSIYARAIHNSLSEPSILVNVDNYIFITWQGNNYLIDYIGEETDIVLPNSYYGSPYAIYTHAFYKKTNLTSVVVPNGVTSIEYSAFSDCSSLRTISIGKDMQMFNDPGCPFINCFSLESVNIAPDNPVYKSVDGVLYSKDGSSLIYYPSSKPDHFFSIDPNTTSIELYAFHGLKNLTTLIIPKSVIYFRGSFYNDTALSVFCEVESIPDSWKESFDSIAVYWYSESAPTAEGNYWHYVNGIPTIWE